MLPDEDEHWVAALLERLATGGAIVPEVWPLEVVNALLVAQRRRRLKVKDIERALRDLAALPISVDQETHHMHWGLYCRLLVNTSSHPMMLRILNWLGAYGSLLRLLMKSCAPLVGLQGLNCCDLIGGVVVYRRGWMWFRRGRWHHWRRFPEQPRSRLPATDTEG
ncbi:MAG: type II toxin-antitoxin system VapC family toxin [Actinobacteria bacterium]|nr:type II toxin-antitoxin system VapC family toxin [Actinomycetota bacterium]